MWESIKRFFLGEPPKAPAVKAEPVKAEPVKVEPVKVEPVKVEPVKVEPVKAVEQKAESSGVVVKSGPVADIGKIVHKPK